MITSYEHFKKFVEEKGYIPSLNEFKELGYSNNTYFVCKRKFKKERNGEAKYNG